MTVWFCLFVVEEREGKREKREKRGG